MSKLTALALLLFIGAANAGSPDLTKNALAFVSLLAAQKYQDAAGQFDDRMKSALPSDKLQTVWQQVTGQEGAFKTTGATKSTEAQDHTVVFVVSVFARGSLWVQIAYDKNGKIGGLHFLPKT